MSQTKIQAEKDKIQEFKANNPISILIEKLNLKKESSNSHCGPCPFCGGKDRFFIRIDKNRFYCRVCTEKGGDIIDFLAREKSLTTRNFISLYIHGNEKGGKVIPIQGKKKKIDISAKWNHFKDLSPACLDCLIGERGLSDTLELKDFKTNDEGTISVLYRRIKDGKPYNIQEIPFSKGSVKPFEKGIGHDDGFYLIGDKESHKIILYEAVIDAVSGFQVLPNLCHIAIGSSTYHKKLSHLNNAHPGKEIIVFHDNDASGRALRNKAKSIIPSLKAVEWNGDGKDTNDLLKADKVDVIRRMIENPVEIEVEPEAKTENEDFISQINKEYAACWVGGKFRVLKQFFNPETGMEDYAFCSIQDFRAAFQNRKIEIPGSDKKTTEANVWISSPKRREYKGVVFSPNGNHEGYFNLWRGLAVKPKKGNWSLFRQHIKDVICNGSVSEFKWLLSWMSRIVQDPGGERPGTSVVLIGKRGTGKGTFAEQLRAIFGAHYLQLSNQKHLTGNFNSHLRDKVVVFVDEGFWAGSKSEEGVLKALITEPFFNIEPKGLDVVQVKNHCNLLIASNNSWVIPAGFSERRFYVTEVSDRHIQDHNYFKALHDEMRNGGAAAMLYDLMNRDTSNDNLRQAPKTEALMSQVELSMDSVSAWFYQRLLDGETFKDSNEWKHFAETNELYKDYKVFNSDTGIRDYGMTIPAFAKKFKQVCPCAVRKKISIGGKRKYGYTIPSLGVCRSEFTDLIGIDEIDWELENE